jgi:DNA-binding CsgD family transcriptional regulator
VTAARAVPSIDVEQLITVADYVITARHAHLNVTVADLGISRYAVEQHMSVLENAWGVIGRPDNQTPRRVIIHPAHRLYVTETIRNQNGIPSVCRPFARLAMPPLSAEQHLMVLYIAQGLSNRQIGRRMGDISVNTVKTHVQTLLKLLKADNRQHLVYRAYRAGLFGDVPKQAGDSHA